MAHPTTSLAQALVTFLNDDARPWSTTAEYRTKFRITADANAAENFTAQRIVVVPMSLAESELADRSGTYRETIVCGIIVVEKLPAGTAWDSEAGSTWIEDKLEEVYAILDECRKEAIALGAFSAIQYTQPQVISDEHIAANLFLSPIMATAIRLT